MGGIFLGKQFWQECGPAERIWQDGQASGKRELGSDDKH